MDPGSIGLDIIGEIGQLILDGADYQALAQSRKLIEYEKTLFNRRPDTDVPADVSPQAEKAPPADVANQLETGS
jgi:flagellar biosynthesis regulator FlbT